MSDLVDVNSPCPKCGGPIVVSTVSPKGAPTAACMTCGLRGVPRRTPALVVTDEARARILEEAVRTFADPGLWADEVKGLPKGLVAFRRDEAGANPWDLAQKALDDCGLESD